MASFTGDDDWVKCFSSTYNSEYWFHTRSGKQFWCSHANPDDKVAIIVPFRDLHADQNRRGQLDEFVPKITEFLLKGGIPFKIFIIEQADDGYKFNRGKLLNIGYVLAALEYYSIFVFHDVDLIPSEELISWYIKRPTKNPIHIAKVWDRYTRNEKYFGGIVSFSKELYESINGYPNNFWGWGGEDDEMYNRVRECKFTIDAPTEGRITDMEEKSLDQKLDELKGHELRKCMNKNELLNEHKQRWKENGLFQFKQTEEQFIITGQEYLSDFCIKITVFLSLNNHWSDNVCKEADSQYVLK